MSTLHSIILAIVEGLTEYLPISSTGHLIVTSALMGINEQSFTKDYTVMVQFGAILSVVVLYWRRFFDIDLKFYVKLVAGFFPAAIIGLLVKNHIDAVLGNVTVVACSLALGGVILILSDKWFPEKEKGKEVRDLTYLEAFAIGMVQCLAFIPGVSRSASTILGGLWQGLNRKAAAEFSFFLAVPTLTGATLLKALKIAKTIQPDQIQALVVGNIIAFIVGVITIKAFIGYLTRHGFKPFGYYRIAVGGLILALMAAGVKLAVL